MPTSAFRVTIKMIAKTAIAPMLMIFDAESYEVA
jgi:hypothetical protein